ncbi:uncharacterized protein LOC141912315 [Tubulanus polymorphus]|uniref:uncharacterized protein LOC141912315 n=1 Tax=Tubulanus polymorphus TaxID=672921 RepID=UPI003DA20D1E
MKPGPDHTCISDMRLLLVSGVVCYVLVTIALSQSDATTEAPSSSHAPIDDSLQWVVVGIVGSSKQAVSLVHDPKTKEEAEKFCEEKNAVLYNTKQDALQTDLSWRWYLDRHWL